MSSDSQPTSPSWNRWIGYGGKNACSSSSVRHTRSCLSDLWDSQSNANPITDQCKEGNCYIVTHISIWGAWSSVSEGLNPPKPPLPWRRDCVAKLQLAVQCNWLGKVLRLRDMWNFLFISMAGPKVSQRIQVVVPILLHEAKPVWGLFCLHLNTVGWSGHVTSTIRRDNW